MSNPLIAEIRMFAGNFAPRGWALCNGQLLSISQNTALFSLLGTTYGGNGQTTFGLPDLRGRVPVGTGQGPGLSLVDLGEVSGSPTHTLNSTEMPAHTHAAPTIPASTTLGTVQEPGPLAIPAGSNQRNAQYAASSTANTQLAMSSATTGSTGGNQPFSVMQPYLGLNYIIALEGIFPSRN
ncbi:tail fiber protein [Acidovorax sp. A79]|uniref:phage tail protein n=1 Tax=unclassified Acidovorax TaxID=2684926 RepID=UPI001C4672A6|nr:MULTISPECIES: tail fiber protein [unclassified Acidovorax]MBV7426582.1 tail fiber protein [Acidovorax sp. sif0732]MBV7447707.1 tail fiber protein [Acidovorax sp. sif0715]